VEFRNGAPLWGARQYLNNALKKIEREFKMKTQFYFQNAQMVNQYRIIQSKFNNRSNKNIYYCWNMQSFDYVYLDEEYLLNLMKQPFQLFFTLIPNTEFIEPEVLAKINKQRKQTLALSGKGAS
jgi:hypothetical protein